MAFFCYLAIFWPFFQCIVRVPPLVFLLSKRQKSTESLGFSAFSLGFVEQKKYLTFFWHFTQTSVLSRMQFSSIKKKSSEPVPVDQLELFFNPYYSLLIWKIKILWYPCLWHTVFNNLFDVGVLVWRKTDRCIKK